MVFIGSDKIDRQSRCKTFENQRTGITLLCILFNAILIYVNRSAVSDLDFCCHGTVYNESLIFNTIFGKKHKRLTI